MFLYRLSLALMILTLVLSACTSRNVPTPAGVQTEVTLAEITRESLPATTQEPFSTLTQRAPTPAGSSTTTPIPTPLPSPEALLPTETPIEQIPTQESGPPPASTEPPVDLDTPGTVSGEICSPGEDSPKRKAYFENIETFELNVLPVAKDQSTFSLHLEPGQYIAYAYLNRVNTPGGLYSAAVPCGLTANCTDHNPLVFRVEPGQTMSGIDICNWSAPEYVPANPAPFDPRLAGLVYGLGGGNYFRYDERGEALLLFTTDSQLVVSPDRGRGVFQDYEENDLFVVDFSSGERYNLTNTPDVYETAYQWEPGLPEKIVFTALKPGQGPEISAGGLFAVNVDGSGRATLDSEHEASRFDLSPDAQTIAYGAGETAWLYTWDTGASVFDPRQYSHSLPDDLRIAWYMLGFFSEQYQEGIGIFDLEAESFQLIHPWAGNGRGPGYPPSGSWSPDGKWLAIYPYETDPERRGVWLVVAENPEKEIFVGPSTTDPLWSPGGNWLAYLSYGSEEDAHHIWLYNLNTGEHEKTSLPPGAQAMDWSD